MRDYKQTIPAGSEVAIIARGSFIKLKQANVELRVRAVNQDGRNVADLLMSKGADASLAEEYVQIKIGNTSENSQTATLILGSGRVDDSQLTGEVLVKQGQTVKTSQVNAGTTAAELLAADLDRLSVTIQNKAAADSVFIGDSTVTTGNGLEIVADSGITIDKAAAGELWIVSEGAGADVRIFEELN